MKEIYQLPDTLPAFYNSRESESVLVEFNNEDILFVIGIVDIRVVEGEIDTWGFIMTADSPTATLYSSGLHGLISISSANKKKAIVALKKNVRADGWKSFMKEYVPGFNVFDVNGTRLTPPKSLIKLEEHLGCWFDLSKTPLSNHRLIIEEQWQGLSDELLMRPNNEPIKILFAGYKNSGKSAMMRYYINRCLKKWDKILVLDFDIGQSEFSIPGCISAFIITSPLLGPNFTHLLQPIKSYFFGSNDVMTNLLLYNEIVSKIVDDIITDNLHRIPCFINTMGFVEGPGLHILHNIIAKTKPTDVIQLKFNENQGLNLHSEMVSDDIKCSLSYDLWYFTSAVKNKSAKAPHILNFNKHLMQHLITTSYFSKCLQCTDVYLNDVVPYKININKISILITNNVEKFSQDELLSIINANMVALCISSETNLCSCVGFGFIRNINKSTGNIYVITPVMPNLLSHINQLRLGNVNLPATFYTKRSKIANYVCIKQDNIFNENITRQYKVML